jgi:hypothetical protein
MKNHLLCLTTYNNKYVKCQIRCAKLAIYLYEKIKPPSGTLCP